MDFKKILLDMAEEQASKMQDEALGFLSSEKFEKEVASKINEKIDIPFVSEAKEQIFFEKVVDVVTDLLQGVFKGKYCQLRPYTLLVTSLVELILLRMNVTQMIDSIL